MEKWILLFVALAVVIVYAIILSWPIPPVHPAEQIPTVGGTYVIDGRVYLVCDANQHSGAAGATVYRGKVFMLFDPNKPPAPPLRSPEKIQE
ncbi:unnamed protein product [marine sediment metagenome]|uniref:Uncharacterized protein n=1 Tax=marine sediment metagenome TaxID=412755 RepID=X1RNC1_9ZZZZ